MHRQGLRMAVALILLLQAWATGACSQLFTTPAATPVAYPAPQGTPAMQASPLPASPAVEASSTAASTTPATTATRTTVQSREPLTLTQVVMHTVSYGWALSLDGHVYHTSSGPAQWQDVTPSQSFQEQIPVAVAAFPPGAPQAAIVAGLQSGAGAQAHILVFRTQDAGETWQASDPLEINSMDMLGLVQLFSQDGQHAWLLGQIYPGMHHVYTSLYASQDGGVHWTLVESPEPDASSPTLLSGSYSLPYGWEVLAFLNDQVGFAGTGDLQVTRDGGKNWKIVSLPKGPNYPHLNQGSEYAAPPRFTSPRDGAFLVRVDEFDSIYCPPCDLFQSLPQALYVYVTHDGGGTWTPYPAPAKIGSLAFLDANHGYFLGKDDPAPETAARFFSTQDGGKTWQPAEAKGVPPLGSALQFVDEQHGYASNLYVQQVENPFQPYDATATSAAYLFQTSDGGLTWMQVGKSAAAGGSIPPPPPADSPAPGETPAAVQAGASTPPEAGSSTRVPPLAAGQAITLTAISMQDSTTGWGIESGGHILRTSDGGQTWRDISPSADFYAPGGVFALDGRSAWATFRSWCGAWVGECQGPDRYLQTATVWRTRDGGQSWQASQPLKLGIRGSRAQLAYFPHLTFTDAQSGWILAWLYASHMGQMYQELFRTTDGGQTWREIKPVITQ